MVRIISQVGGGTYRSLTVAAMVTALAACGSSGSGSGDAEATVDLNGDGVIDSLDIDTDGDNIADVDDIFIDADFDGFDDFTGLTEAEAIAAANASDIPGDEDNDGFVDVSDANQCGSESGTDNNSATATWGDNCTVQRSGEEDENGQDLDGEGQFADSLYAVGIQRVVSCTGFGPLTIDGEYGPGSETATQAFQRSEGLTDDGVVGAQTWARLEAQVEVLVPGVVGSTPDTMGFSTGDCAGIPMFYQFTSASEDNLGIVLGRWELARNAPDSDQRVAFSIGSPFSDF